jgi:hypothetical protein
MVFKNSFIPAAQELALQHKGSQKRIEKVTVTFRTNILLENRFQRRKAKNSKNIWVLNLQQLSFALILQIYLVSK